MWKESPVETKNQYKERATRIQEEFKRNHPNFSCRPKKPLSELLKGISQCSSSNKE